MLRALMRIQQKPLVNLSLVYYHSAYKKAIRPYKLKDDQRMISWDYFVNSDRHQMFLKESKNLYQFDDETRNVTTWQSIGLQKMCEWDQPTSGYTNDEVIQAFISLLNYSNANNMLLSEPIFDQFIDEFAEKLQKFTLNELMRALQIFARHDLKFNIKQRNYIELIQAFDQACTINSMDLVPEQLLFLSSIWFTIPNAKDTYFAQLVCRLFNRYMKTTMTAPQMAQALFYINTMSKPIDDIRVLENIFEKNIDDLSIEEFSTVLWTFIRLNTKIEKQELRNKFFDYLEKQNLGQLSEADLTKILIITSRIHATYIAKTPQWLQIAKGLRENLDSRSLKTCILMVNVGVPIRDFDDEVILSTYKRCLNHPDEFEDLSMSDLEYLSRILSMSNYHDQEIVRQVGVLLLQEIKNRLLNVASRGFYEHFGNIVRNLTMIDVYDVELMDNLFRPDYIKCIHKHSKQVDMQLYEIDGYNRLNLKDIYNGNTLHDDYLDRLCYLINYVPDRVGRYKKLDEFAYAIEDVVNKLFTYSKYTHAVGHRRHADLMVCLNKSTLKTIDISENFPPLYSGRNITANTLTKNDPNLIVFAFVASNTKEYLIDVQNKYEDIPLGYLAQKIGQLKLLGFHPITIPIHIWKESGDFEAAIENLIVDQVNKEFREIGINGRLKATK